jgi:lysophospholipase L1-like esterase
MKKRATKNKRRAIALLFGIFLLAVFELLLRLFNVAPPERPLSDVFAGHDRLFLQNGKTLSTNPDKKKYFIYQSFPKEKKQGTLRIFLTGGSAAMGFPLQEVYGPDRLLSEALDAVETGREHEVINAGGFGFASYRLIPVVEELLGYNPDAIVLLTGNNEFLERRFESATETGGRKLLHHLRLYRVFVGAVYLVNGKCGEVNWDAHQVGERERELVKEDFRSNIEAISRLCREHKVPLVIVVPPSNLKDYRPYGESRTGLETMTEIDGLLKEKHYKKALALIKESRGDRPDAWLLFEEGHVRAGLDNAGPSPQTLWTQARDLDPVPVRVISPMQNSVRRMSAPHEVATADAAAAFENTTVVAPGDQLFFDHCHPRPAGQRVLAMEILRTLVGNDLIIAAPGWQKRAEKALERAFHGLDDKALARSYYQAAYEAGINMGRTCRGLRLVRTCLELGPGHKKARALEERLRQDKGHYCLTGD